MNAPASWRSYLLAAIAVVLAVLAVGQIIGGLWWLIAEGDTGVLVLTPIVVFFEALLAFAAWRRTPWTKRPIRSGGLGDRDRALTRREVLLIRLVLAGTSLLALLGMVLSWWDYAFPLIVVFTMGAQFLTTPPHQRRQILGLPEAVA